MFQPHDYIMLLHFYDVSTDVPLPDFLSLPSASYTRQKPGYTRQRALGKAPDGKGVFAECHFSGTRQRGCRESTALGKFATWGGE